KPRPSGRIGQRTRRLDTPDKVTGEAKFGIDVSEDGMRYAAVRSAPTLAGKIASYDASSVDKQEGVVIRVDSRTIAVVAKSYWTAQRLVDDLSVTFEDQKTPLSSAGVFAEFSRHLANDRPFVFRDDGNVDDQWAGSSHVLEASYYMPYLAHICMEPINCTARFT